MHTLVEGIQTLIGECYDNGHRESEFDSSFKINKVLIHKSSLWFLRSSEQYILFLTFKLVFHAIISL